MILISTFIKPLLMLVLVFYLLMNKSEREKSCLSRNIGFIEKSIQGQEYKYIETFISINPDLDIDQLTHNELNPDLIKTDPLDKLKTFTAKLLFDRKFTVLTIYM